MERELFNIIWLNNFRYNCSAVKVVGNLNVGFIIYVRIHAEHARSSDHSLCMKCVRFQCLVHPNAATVLLTFHRMHQSHVTISRFAVPKMFFAKLVSTHPKPMNIQLFASFQRIVVCYKLRTHTNSNMDFFFKKKFDNRLQIFTMKIRVKSIENSNCAENYVNCFK